jgi:hypothetical protein
MAALDAHRSTAFLVALIALVAGAAAISFVPSSDPGASARDPRQATRGRSVAMGQRSTGAAALSAVRFTAGYLRYEEGVLGPTERRSIREFSTPDFGGQLLHAPVRIPPGAHPPRQWVARVATVRAGIFDGRPALVAIVVIAATDGGHLLRATLTEVSSRWLVAGVGP